MLAYPLFSKLVTPGESNVPRDVVEAWLSEHHALQVSWPGHWAWPALGWLVSHGRGLRIDCDGRVQPGAAPACRASCRAVWLQPGILCMQGLHACSMASKLYHLGLSSFSWCFCVSGVFPLFLCIQWLQVVSTPSFLPWLRFAWHHVSACVSARMLSLYTPGSSPRSSAQACRAVRRAQRGTRLVGVVPAPLCQALWAPAAA